MIVRYVRKQMVSYMVVCEVMEYIVQDFIILVDCVQCFFKLSLFFVGEVWYFDIGVLQVGDYY